MQRLQDQNGSGVVTAILLFVILGIIGFTGWFVYQSQQSTSDTLDKTGKSSNSQMTTKTAAESDSLVYTSAVEKATFTYPSDWQKTSVTGLLAGASDDSIALKSPDGSMIISWVAGIDGLGGACDAEAVLGSDDAACPVAEVSSHEAIPGADGLYVVSGIATDDGSTYHPWMAVQTKSGITNAVGLPYEVFEGSGPYSALFAIGGLYKTLGTPAFDTKAAAGAYLQTDTAKAAKEILLSLTYN